MKTHALILVLLLFISSCDKERYYSIKEVRLKNALSFEEGSYFIYRDSASGEMDTVVCINAANGMRENTQRPNEYHELSETKFSSTTNHQYYLAAGGGPDRLDKIWGLLNFEPGTGPTYTIQFELVKLPFQVNEKLNYSTSELIYVSYHDSLEIEGKFYKQVYETITKNAFDTNNIFIIHTFFSLESALIKYSWRDNSEQHSFHLLTSKIYR